MKSVSSNAMNKWSKSRGINSFIDLKEDGKQQLLDYGEQSAKLKTSIF